MGKCEIQATGPRCTRSDSTCWNTIAEPPGKRSGRLRWVNWAVCQPAPCSACTEPTGNAPELEAARTAALLAIASPFSLDNLNPGLYLVVNFARFRDSRCVCRFAASGSSAVLYPPRPINGTTSADSAHLPSLRQSLGLIYCLSPRWATMKSTSEIT